MARVIVGTQEFIVPDGTTQKQAADAIRRSGALRPSGSGLSDRPLGQAPRGELSRGVSSGVDQMQGTAFGLAALVGDTLGNDELRDFGLRGYERNSQEASVVGPRVSSLKDIHDVNDFFDASAGWIGQSIPSLASTLTTGGAGGFIGKKVAEKSIARMVGKGIEKKAAEAAIKRQLASPEARKQIMSAIKVGAGTGAFAASAGQQQGELFGQLKEAGIEDAAAPAWAFGAVMGALDVIPEFAVAKKLLPGQVEKQLADSIARGIVKTTGKQAAIEGSTEGAQNALGSFARITSGGANWNDEDTEGLLDSMAAGAIVGTVVGASTEIASRVRSKKNERTSAGVVEPTTAPGNVQPARPADVRVPQQPPSPAPAGPQAPTQGAGKVALSEQAPVQPVTPTAEPRADIEAQLRDLSDPNNPRRGVYLSAANLAAHPEISTPKGMRRVANVDEQGGVLFARPKDAIELYQRAGAGESMDKLIGEFTLAGDGKPQTDNPAVVQQKNEGAVTAETVVDANDPQAIGAAMQRLERDGRTTEVMTPEDALVRRDTQIALDQLSKAQAQFAAAPTKSTNLELELIDGSKVPAFSAPRNADGTEEYFDGKGNIISGAAVKRWRNRAEQKWNNQRPPSPPREKVRESLEREHAVANGFAQQTANGDVMYDIKSWKLEQIATQDAKTFDAVDQWDKESESDIEGDDGLSKTDSDLPYTYIGIGDRTHGEQRLLNKAQRDKGEAAIYTARPWQGEGSQQKAESLAERRQASDPDATYMARFIDETEAAQRGLAGSGWYVAVYQHPSTEMGSAYIAGGPRTANQLTQIFIQRAKDRWNKKLSEKQKSPGKGDPVYGFRAKVLDANGTQTRDASGKPLFINMAASEVTQLGQSIYPELRGQDAMSVRDAFRAGLGRLYNYIDKSGFRYVPESLDSKNPTFPGRLVIRDEYKQGGAVKVERMFLAEAHKLAKEQSRAGGREVEQRTRDDGSVEPIEDARLREVANGGPANTIGIATGESTRPQRTFVPASSGVPAFSGIDRPEELGTNVETPVADNRYVGDGNDTRGYETEEQQNMRSSPELQRSQRNSDGYDPAPETVGAGRAADSYNKPVQVYLSDPREAERWTGIANALRGVLGLDNTIVVADSTTELSRIARQNGADPLADKLAIQQDARGRDGLPAGFVGHSNKVSYVYLNPSLFANKTPASAIKTLAHEFGHIFFRQHQSNWTPEQQQAVYEAFERDRLAGEPTANRAKDSNGNAMSDAGQFEEWFADQISAYLAVRREPQTAIEKFFRELAENFKAIWQIIAKHYPLNSTAAELIDASIKGHKANDVFDSLGEANGIMFDTGLPLREPSKAMKELWTQARAWKAKHPTLSAALDGVASTTMAMHDGFTASLHARIRRMKIPSFDKIVEHFHLRPGQEGGFTFQAAVANRMRNFSGQFDSIVDGVSNMSGLLEELRSERPLEQISVEHRERVRQIRDLFARLHAYQRETHLAINEVRNYFPQIGDVGELLKPDAVDTIFNALQQANVKWNIPGGQAAITRQQVVDWVASMTDDTLAIDFKVGTIEDTSANMSEPFQQALRTRALPDEVRTVIRSIKDEQGRSRFYNKDLKSIVHRYIFQATRRAEFNRRFGDVTWDSPAYAEMWAKTNQDPNLKGPPFQPFQQFDALMDSARREGATVDQQKLMYDAMSAFLGQYNRITSEPLRKLTRGVMFYQNLRTLLLVTLSSFPEIATLFVRTGNFGATWDTIRRTAADSFAKNGDTSKMLRAFGFAVDELDALHFDDFKQARDYNTKLDRANEAWFRMTGLTRWTNFMRGLSLNVSLDYLKNHGYRVANGLDESGDSLRRLEELGLTAADVKLWAESGERIFGQFGVTPEDVLAGKSDLSAEQVEAARKVTGAITRMINEITVNPTAAMKPLWRSDERVAFATQLGSFTYGFVNVVLARVWHELTRGGATNAHRAQMVLSIALMLPLVALGIEMKELLQYRLWGLKDPTSKMSAPQYLATLIQRSGVTGIAQLGIDASNSASANKSPFLAFFGPTVSQMSDAWTQPVYKTIPGAIPIIATFPGVRDPIRKELRSW